MLKQPVPCRYPLRFIMLDESCTVACFMDARAVLRMRVCRKAVADAAAAAQARQRSKAPSSPATTDAAAHGRAQSKAAPASAGTTAPVPKPAAPSPSATPALPAASCKAAPASDDSCSNQTEQEPSSGASGSRAQPQPHALQASSPASAAGSVSTTGPAAAHAPPAEPPAVAPERAQSGHPSSSGSDSSYVLVDAPATDTCAAPAATTAAQAQAHDTRLDHKSARDAVAASSSSPGLSPSDSRPQGGDQSKADIMRVKGIDAWKAGDMDRALGLWCQAAQLAPQDYRVHLNISQVRSCPDRRSLSPVIRSRADTRLSRYWASMV